MAKLKNWQLIIFTALITTVLSVCGSWVFYGYTSKDKKIKNAASETYVDAKVHGEKTMRERADGILEKRIFDLDKTKADNTTVETMAKQIQFLYENEINKTNN